MVKPPSQTLQNIQACQKVSTHNFKVHFSPPLNGLIVCLCTIAQQFAVAETSFFSLLVLVMSINSPILSGQANQLVGNQYTKIMFCVALYRHTKKPILKITLSRVIFSVY